MEHQGLALLQEVLQTNRRQYDPELEPVLVDWILSQCDGEFDRPEPGEAASLSWPKDGCVSHQGSLKEPVFFFFGPVDSHQQRV